MGIFRQILEAKDSDYDYNKAFQIAIIPEEKAIVVKQLFNFITKYPIYIKADDLNDKIGKEIAKIKEYDVDVDDIDVDLSGDVPFLVLTINVDSKQLDKRLLFKLSLNGNKQKIDLM